MSDPEVNSKGSTGPEFVERAKAKADQPIPANGAALDGNTAVTSDEPNGKRETNGEPAEFVASTGNRPPAETHAGNSSSALNENRQDSPDQIEAEAEGLREKLAPLDTVAWASQTEALKNATAAAREYRIAIADLGMALDAVSGRFDLYAKGLNRLSATHRRFVRTERELTSEVMIPSEVDSTPALAPGSSEQGDRPASPPIPGPISKVVSQPVDPSTLTGLTLFSQAETIVAGGSATPQQQQFLANLASVMSAHSLTYQQAIEYFKINEGNLQIVTNILEHHKTAIANFAARLDALGH